MDDKITKIVFAGWRYSHKDTYELLSVLRDKDLNFIPSHGPKFQSLGFQFGCIISAQLTYAKMLKEKKYSSKHYYSDQKKTKISSTIKSVRNFLRIADRKLTKEMEKINDDDIFDWGDTKTPMWRVIAWLSEHERLHHGELIIYFTLANLSLPANFKKRWHL